MTHVRLDGGATYEMTLEARCDASPAAVYDVLADLSSHLDWAGKRQHRNFRLISLRGTGPLKTGSEFTSVGSIPMARSRWEDHSEVVEARPPEVLEFVTDSLVVWRSGKRTEAVWEHRYEITPDGSGSSIVYRLRRTAIENPPLRMSLPLMRTLTNRVMIPRFCRRGFENLLRSAELRSSMSGVVQTRHAEGMTERAAP